MLTRQTFIPAVLALLILWVGGTGCAANRRRESAVRNFSPDSLTNLTAYRSGTNLQIWFTLKGKDAMAHTFLSPGRTNGADHRAEFALLTYDRQPLRLRSAVGRPANQIPVLDNHAWEELVQEVFASLVPSQPGHGVVLPLANRELILARDAEGKLAVTKLEDKPAGWVVDRTFNDTDFSRQAIENLVRRHGTNTVRNQLIFATEEDPAYVFFDLRQRRVVFLSEPADPESFPPEIPGWFALRTANHLLIRSLLLTAIKNPVTLVGRGLWHLGGSGAVMLQSGSGNASETIPPLSSGPGMDLKQWEAHLDELLGPGRYPGKVDFLVDGERFFPALIQSVEDAKTSVDMQIYIFDTDDYAVKIADLLKRRSSEIRVRVLMDAMGSMFAAAEPPGTPMPTDFVAPDDIESYLTAGSKVKVRSASNPWLTGDHRKCILIDNKQAYVGGMNIGREYRYEWHDLMVRLTGPIVSRLVTDYREAWAHAGPWGDFAYSWAYLFRRINPRTMEIPETIDIRPLRTATAKVDIYRAQLDAIQKVKKYIYIENAYFGDDTILRELIRARRRGVDVRVILPAENNHDIMRTANQVFANRMLENGIRVFAFPGMSHVKAAVYDGWACLGSANFDKMSLRISQELDISFSDPATVERLQREVFEKDFSRSVELKTPAPSGWLDSLVKTLADQL